MLDEVEERALGPLDVVEHDDERPRAGDLLDQPSDRPGRALVLGDRIDDADRLRDPLGDEVRVGSVAEQSADARASFVCGLVSAQLGGLPDRLLQRPVRDALAVREAASLGDRRVVGPRAEELLDQAGLPDACIADHRHEPAHAVA